MLELIDEMADHITALEADNAELREYVEELDHDLGEVEEELYFTDDDDCYDEDEDEDFEDEDDGYYYTKSDIVIVDVTGNNYQQLTTSSDEIKMFPSVSADGSKIAYHTSDGKIYVMTIKEK